jgi:hypothetical protein
LVLPLASSPPTSAASPAARSVRTGQQTRQQLHEQAQVAAAALETAFKSIQHRLTLNATTEKNDLASGNAAGARKTLLSDATALVHFWNVLLATRFPGSMEADLPSLATSTINVISTYAQASDPDEDFSAAVMAANQSLTAWVNDWSLVRRDLQHIIDMS